MKRRKRRKESRWKTVGRWEQGKQKDMAGRVREIGVRMRKH